uniref:Ribosomal protein L13 n=1 Tax=Porphyridium sordidum TaxID=28024 RepID=A0A1C9CE30_PORSO|nr:ribosomal protein L13 [Porphyridium sordidum]AOM66629.1 ribosomal protein L13 [Porphyridium sordidum]
MNKTIFKNKQHLNSTWYLVDAKGKTLGRLASKVAYLLRGKNSPFYSPESNLGNYVIIINSDQIIVAGKKNIQKVYKRHSGTPGGMKTETFKDLQTRIPNRIVEQAIKGMLPKGPLGRKLFTQLKVYSGEVHNHHAQMPKTINL